MRRNVWIRHPMSIMAVLTLATMVQAQESKPEAKTPAAPAAPAPIDPQGKRMEQLLNSWAQQSTRLKTLDVRIKETVKMSEAWGGEERYEGRALFKAPNLAWINFEQVPTDEKQGKKPIPHERIICTGKEVWHYLCKTQQIHIYPLAKQQRDRALQEGPLPFLFNFRAEEAKVRYRMALLNEDKDSYIISVFPNEDIDKESFSKAFIRLDRKYLLPTQVVLYPADEKSGLKSFVLTDIKPNNKVMDDNFRGEKLGKPWTIHINDENSNPVPGNGPQNSRRSPQQRQPVVGKGASPARTR
ncbi:outer membrane lipoprotein-sorting protein [Singulisphaera sp. PoT]|uniref:outer membrane lipoprotein-sorting protein n=1 Tax=Singulisphaera sp. PoT TaxID=3411797 RepID=UPI003BF5B0E2